MRTGYVSAWMRRRGASVYAIDNSEAQLATARRLSDLHGLDDIEWVHGNAETVAQPDGSFDFAISEYGAAIWCEPMALDRRGAPAASSRRRARVPRQPSAGDGVLTDRTVRHR